MAACFVQTVRAFEPPAKASPALRIARDTTYFIEPVDGDGYVDYAAALNEITSQGITPQNNAYALLWSAWGPHAGRSNISSLTPASQVAERVCKSLSIPVPPEDGTYLISLAAFIRSLSPDEQRIAFMGPAFQNEQDIRDKISMLHTILDGPWSGSDHPIILQWLKRNQKPLDVAVKACKRTGFYAPLYFSNDGWTWASEEISSVLVPVSEIAWALRHRSQFRVSESQLDGAWEDVVASIRLSRLIGQSPELIALLMGGGIQAISMDPLTHFCGTADISEERFAEMLAAVRALGPISPEHRTLNIHRLSDLAHIQFLAHPPLDRSSGNSLIGIELSIAAYRNLLLAAGINWNEVMRATNRRYDRRVEIARM